MTRMPLKEGQVWVTTDTQTRTRTRRVVAVIDGKVCYSTGGNALRWCQRRMFRLWARSYGAKPTRSRQKRSLTLRPRGASA